MSGQQSLQSVVLWALVLAALLFFPVRHLIWVLAVRRAEGRQQAPTDEATRSRLKRRANVTSVLLCLVFSFIYTLSLIQGRT